MAIKLVVMIPTLNEEKTIAGVIEEIPKQIDGIDETEVIIIDGASKDGTVNKALKAGASHAYSDHINRGLASAFKTGIRKSLLLGADIIVNTDADLQYDQKEIPKIIAPILEGRADMVVGSRFRGWIEGMPLKKRIGNRMATSITSALVGQRVSDAQSGFRAIHRELALRLVVESKKTYVQETLIRSIRRGYKVLEVPIRFRKREDESRLISNIWSYALSVFPDLILTYAQVAPFRMFGTLALSLLIVPLPVLVALSLVSLTLSLPLILAAIQFLVPSMILLMGIGVILDHQERHRRWQLDMRALDE